MPPEFIHQMNKLIFSSIEINKPLPALIHSALYVI